MESLVAGALTGHDFPPPQADGERQAISTMNGLGLKLTQPVSAASPVAQSIEAYGEGVGTLSIVCADIESAVARARAAGLRLKYKSQRQAEFERADFLGLAITLVKQN